MRLRIGGVGAVQERAPVLQCPGDEVVVVAEVDRLDAERTREGRTISCASSLWSSMSAMSRRCVSRLIACSAIARAPRGGVSGAPANPADST